MKLDINADKPDWSTFADILKVQNLRIEINTCYKNSYYQGYFHLTPFIIFNSEIYYDKSEEQSICTDRNT